MFDEIAIYDPKNEKRFGYVFMKFDDSGLNDSAVKISQKNVEDIVEQLNPLIDPEERKKDVIYRLSEQIRQDGIDAKLFGEILDKAIEGKIDTYFYLYVLDEIKKTNIESSTKQKIIKTIEKMKLLSPDIT
ncbi:MAG: hypothetical protein HQK84_12215 [Nitrospinae bacterium]|nr:hypothetical protein [Nitrospinota bacterium]